MILFRRQEKFNKYIYIYSKERAKNFGAEKDELLALLFPELLAVMNEEIPELQGSESACASSLPIFLPVVIFDLGFSSDFLSSDLAGYGGEDLSSGACSGVFILQVVGFHRRCCNRSFSPSFGQRVDPWLVGHLLPY